VPIVLKSGSLSLLEPSGAVQACNGIALPLTHYTVSHLRRPVLLSAHDQTSLKLFSFLIHSMFQILKHVEVSSTVYLDLCETSPDQNEICLASCIVDPTILNFVNIYEQF